VAGVLGVQALEASVRASVGDLDEGVVMVAKQDVGEQCDLPRPEGGVEPVEEVGTVFVAEEEVATIASMRGDVVDAGVVLAWPSSHASEGKATDDLPTAPARLASDLQHSGLDSRARTTPVSDTEDNVLFSDGLT
jgi:hypothetical protein